MGIKNILYISTEFPPGPGGIGNHTWNLSRKLNNSIPVHVLTVSDYADKNQCIIFDNKEKMYVYRFNKYKLSLITYLQRIFDIVLHLRKNRYSHCILSGKFSLYISLIVRLFSSNTRQIGILHGSELLPSTRISSLLLIKSLKSLDIAISVSGYTNKLIPNNSINNSQRYIVPNGVNIEEINKKNYRHSLQLAGEPCLLTVGSITHRKGQVNLVNSLPLIIKHYPKVHYHCIGLPIEKDEILKKARQLNVEKHLTLHGFISNNKLYGIYNQADIFIMLSQNDIKFDVEGFGIAILEANLLGIPAIGSRDTGIEDAIVHNETGKLVDPYSVEEILEAIDETIINKEKLSMEAIEWARQHNWTEITTQYLRLIANA